MSESKKLNTASARRSYLSHQLRRLVDDGDSISSAAKKLGCDYKTARRLLTTTEVKRD